MGIASGLWVILLGVVALVSARTTPTKPVTPGAVAVAIVAFLLGPISALWGVWGCLSALLNIAWIGQWPIYWLTWVSNSFVQIGAGAAVTLRAVTLLGGLDIPRARKALTPLGIFGIVLGVWMIAAGLIFNVGAGK